jgi:hypothetical protein
MKSGVKVTPSRLIAGAVDCSRPLVSTPLDPPPRDLETGSLVVESAALGQEGEHVPHCLCHIILIQLSSLALRRTSRASRASLCCSSMS